MKEKKKFYGWKLAVVLGIIYFCSSSFVLAAASIVNPMMFMSGEMKIDATMLGLGFTIFVICQGLPTPIIGQVIAKIGAKRTMAIGGAIMLISALAMSFFVREVWSYIIFFGILMSIGSMALGQISAQTVASSWFHVNRGKAMTVVMVIGGLGSILAPIIVKTAIELSGGSWQAGWYALIAAACIGIVLAVFLVRNKPQDIGQEMDGYTAQAVAEESKQKLSKVYKNQESIPYRKALKTPAFWFITLGLAAGYTAFSLNTSQGVLIFTSHGYDPTLIVAAVSMMGFALLLGRFVIGSISDHIEPIRLMSLGGVMLVLAILLAIFADPSQPFMMFTYYAVLGFFFGGINTVGPTAFANYFGPGDYSKILGTAIMILAPITAPIATIVGATLDATGSFAPGFFYAAGVVAVCTIFSCFVRFPKKSAVSEQTPVSAETQNEAI